MKLFNANLSPFAGRCRIAIYAKGLEIEFADPPGGLASEEYRAINPTGKVPALVDGDFVLPESQTICEYLEDTHPEPALRPADAQERATARLLSRIADLYVIPPMAALFGQIEPAGRDQTLIADKLDELYPAFDLVEHWLDGSAHAVGGRLSFADCTLFPVYFFATRLVPLLGGPDILATRPKTKTWFAGVVETEAAVAKVGAEMQTALTAFMEGS